MKFSQLPAEIQTAVKNELHSVKIDYVNQQCRYFANHGFKSAVSYREFLFAQSLPMTGEQMAIIIKSVLVQFLKAGKDHLYVLPERIAYDLRQTAMLSKAEIARKVQ